MGLFLSPECQQNGSVFIEEDMLLKRKGLASYLMVKCSNCNFNYSTYTYKGVLDNQQAWRRTIEVFMP